MEKYTELNCAFSLKRNTPEDSPARAIPTQAITRTFGLAQRAHLQAVTISNPEIAVWRYATHLHQLLRRVQFYGTFSYPRMVYRATE
jgi:hypothetical protein